MFIRHSQIDGEFDDDLKLVYELEKDKSLKVKERVARFVDETGKSRRTYFRYKKKLKKIGLV